MVNFGRLSAEIGWRVLGTPANFNGFRVLASLLHRRCSTEVNQTLRAVWPSPNVILPGAKFTLRPSFAFSYIGTALEQWASAKLCGVVSSHDRAAIPFDIGQSNCSFSGSNIMQLHNVATAECRVAEAELVSHPHLKK